ncbi:halide peroxidase [Burkholderia humptydooensis MSMB43]|uniref:Halide peroxidase n=1 Tax=Burkholderia humptydooensis MSMB43 TaxID=441157 RepID=A0ABN0FXQ2_9BURK|nr:halide peroxidase [Burkholderia humptydooensis MSMB43]
MQTNAPRANLHVLGKHMMFWEHADQFNQFLDQFLAQFH